MMIIRPAALADAPGIAHVHVASWRTTYPGIMPDEVLNSLSVENSTARWERSLTEQRPGHPIIVAEVDGQIVGFASGGPERSTENPKLGEVYAIYLLADSQRQGIGQALIRAAVEALAAEGFTELLIWVAEENPARGFYEHIGGTLHGAKADEFGGKLIREVSYYWDNLAGLVKPRG